MAKSRRKPLTPSQKQYSRELGALKTRIANAEKLGYVFPESIIPKRPQRIRKESIERLHSLRDEELYKRAISAPTPEEIQYRNEVRKLERRIKTAEKLGFKFYNTIHPERYPERKISKEDIEAIRQLRGEKLYERAWIYSEEIKTSNPDELGDRPKQYYDTNKAIKILKERRRERNIKNLNIITQDFKDIGEALYNEYNAISTEQEKANFIRSLPENYFNALTWAISQKDSQKNKGGKDNVRQTDVGTGGQTGQNILPDEGLEYSEDEGYSEEGYEPEPERPVTTINEEPKRKAFNEEITDEEIKKWRESYEKQKRLPKKEREYIYDGDAIYAGIVNRLMQFQDDYSNDQKRYAGGYSMYKKFKTMLENEIKISGFNTVMKRLDGKGIEIDTALEAMLYDDSNQERKGHPAFQQLAEIITGRAMTQQESAQLAAISESWGYDTEDNPSYQIDR